MSVVAIVLTFNEEKHIDRCLKSLAGAVDRIVIVDCYSTDATVEIAKSYGAEILYNKWVNHSQQFNWALNNIQDADWIFRIDADEVITANLAEKIKDYTFSAKEKVNGFYINRRIFFLGDNIKYGGVFPVRILRLFRYGFGKCENRWMDEHIVVTGETKYIKEEIHDINLNSLSWWVDKHNKYASLEAFEVLTKKYSLYEQQSSSKNKLSGQAGFKRLIKDNIYNRLPIGLRALIYFLYRFFIRLGFLDGTAGIIFHVLQGFWYRYLVDSKIYEVEKYSKDNSVSVEKSIEEVLKVESK